MRHSKPILITLALALAGTAGGVAVATAPHSSPTAAAPATRSAQTVTGGSTTVNAATTTLDGVSQQILVDARGLPLYTYNRDTNAQSHVSGGLAQLWPPLLSSSPTESGSTGKLSVLPDANGQQVLYNGHFLYTFVNDAPGQVTGQGIQGFFVATPDLSPKPNAATSNPAPAQHRNAYGY